ncbi:MAG: TonB-dependent receptor [Sphingobium sp.]
MSVVSRRGSFVFNVSVLALAMAAPMQAAHAEDAAAADAERAVGSILSGHVYDESGSALPGARIFVPELNSEATTDLQGEFVMPAPAQGDVTVRVEYLGRPTVSRPATLGGRQTILDIVVPRGSANDIVVIGASLVDNTARALNQQRQADNTINVISADAIGRFPDPNIAEALQRVAGIGIQRDQGEGRYINIRGGPKEFATVTVDGVAVGSVDPTTRAVDLDTIPSDIVANLEVTKSLLPNQDADAIAGSVNIATRSAFDKKGTSISGMAGASYNQFGKTSDKRGSLSASTRFGADKQFGIMLAGSYSKTERKPDNVENTWAETATGSGLYRVTETAFKDYDTSRERISVNGALEWRPSPGNRLYLRGSYARFEDDEYRNRLLISWGAGTLQAGSTDTAATYTNTRLEKQVRHRIQRNQIYTATVGGENLLGEGRVEYSATYSRSLQTYPRRDEVNFRSTLRPTLSYDFANPDSPAYSLFNAGNQQHLNVASYNYQQADYRSNTARNEEYGFSIKGEVPVNLGSVPVTFSAGSRYRDRNVTSDEERFRASSSAGVPSGTLASFLSSEASQNFDYYLGNKIDPSKADAYFDQYKSAASRRVSQSTTADYTAKERVLGLFGMAKFDLGPTTVIAGIRYETTELKMTAGAYLPANTPSNPTSTLVITNRVASQSYGNWFPNLTVRQAFTPELIGRFALSRGINRPNFPEVVPRLSDESETGITRVVEGNPDLRPTLSNNIDAGLEYYIRPVGVLSVNAFYKDLEDFRFTLLRRTTTTEYTRAENAPKGHLWGVELSWQQQFTFLPGLLSGFGIFANYTWTDAEAKLSQAFSNRTVMPLPGQSKTSWNLALFYEKGPFNTRVSYTKRSDYLDAIDASNPGLDLYWEGRGQLDATGSYQLLKTVNLFVEAKNLTNSAGVRYYGTRQRVYEYEKFGYSIFGGVRFKL